MNPTKYELKIYEKKKKSNNRELRPWIDQIARDLINVKITN